MLRSVLVIVLKSGSVVVDEGVCQLDVRYVSTIDLSFLTELR
jgi:hypothetical protein